MYVFIFHIFIYTQYSICMYSPFFLGPWPNPRHVLSMSSSDEAMSDRCDSEDDACEKNIKAVGGPPKKVIEHKKWILWICSIVLINFEILISFVKHKIFSQLFWYWSMANVYGCHAWLCHDELARQCVKNQGGPVTSMLGKYGHLISNMFFHQYTLWLFNIAMV